MDDKVTVEFDADTMSALNRMAEAHGRGVDAEVRDIVSRNVRKPMTRAEFVRRAKVASHADPLGPLTRAHQHAYHRSTALAQVKPAPKATSSTTEPD